MELEKGVQRWIFDISSWNPSPHCFSFALSFLPNHEFVKSGDQKRALMSRLLQYALVHQVLEIPFDKIIIRRTPEDEEDEDEADEEEGGLSKSGKELKKLLGRANELSDSDGEEEEEDDDDGFDALLALLDVHGLENLFCVQCCKELKHLSKKL